jgi:hypothetical protein
MTKYNKKYFYSIGGKKGLSESNWANSSTHTWEIHIFVTQIVRLLYAVFVTSNFLWNSHENQMLKKYLGKKHIDAGF